MKRVFAALVICVVTGMVMAFPAAAQDNIYRSVLEKEVEVVSDGLNIRTGPGTKYPVTGTVARGDILQVLGGLGNWYVVCLKDGSIGVISSKHVKVHSMSESFMPQGGDDEAERADTEVGMAFTIANRARKENGLTLFEWDEKLNALAQLKAEDMHKNGYFGHYSPVYGTPFAMLKQVGGYAYKTASENVAGSISVESAMASIMASPSHRSNILNSRFNKMGVGIVDDDKYGKIVVQLFIEE